MTLTCNCYSVHFRIRDTGNWGLWGHLGDSQWGGPISPGAAWGPMHHLSSNVLTRQPDRCGQLGTVGAFWGLYPLSAPIQLLIVGAVGASWVLQSAPGAT
jgi:hypothetical protein